MAPAKARPSPLDRFTEASPSAITSGFSAAMAIGPQPKNSVTTSAKGSEGADWLRSLRAMSGIDSGTFPDSMNANDGRIGDEEDLSDEEDGDSDNNSPAAPAAKGKKGRGKDKESKGSTADTPAAQRKAQNRIAQREFRQRKQQYIRALEARVELLSSDHDTQVDRLRYALRGLLAENNQLRGMLAKLSFFVGVEQIGGPLQSAGMSRQELEEMILGSSEKTMTKMWQNWPGARECEALRQIRLESNLPPEGLPESQKLPEHVKGADTTKTKTKKQGNTNGTTESVSSNGRSGQKRKTRDAEEEVEQATTQDTVGNNSSSNFQQIQSLPSASSHLAHFHGDENNPALMNLLFQPQLSGYQNDTSLFNVPENSTAQTLNQDAILASLFGVSGMRDHSTGLFASSPSLPAFAHSVSNAVPEQDSSPLISDSEGSEEIKRIAGFVHKIRSSYEALPTRSEADLSRVARGLSQLIVQMSNFRRQPSYQLPPLLEPCDVQQTRPHDPLVDVLPFTGLRERLILQQETLNIDDLLLSFLNNVALHPGSVMEASNWEIKEPFFLAYPQLVDREMLITANNWRATRNETPISL